MMRAAALLLAALTVVANFRSGTVAEETETMTITLTQTPAPSVGSPHRVAFVQGAEAPQLLLGAMAPEGRPALQLWPMEPGAESPAAVLPQMLPTRTDFDLAMGQRGLVVVREVHRGATAMLVLGPSGEGGTALVTGEGTHTASQPRFVRGAPVAGVVFSRDDTVVALAVPGAAPRNLGHGTDGLSIMLASGEMAHLLRAEADGFPSPAETLPGHLEIVWENVGASTPLFDEQVYEYDAAPLGSGVLVIASTVSGFAAVAATPEAVTRVAIEGAPATLSLVSVSAIATSAGTTVAVLHTSPDQSRPLVYMGQLTP